MKIWCLDEPIFDRDGMLIGNICHELTEADILDRYWKWWWQAMVKKYGEGHELITRENCIEDFVVVNWCYEKGSK